MSGPRSVMVLLTVVSLLAAVSCQYGSAMGFDEPQMPMQGMGVDPSMDETPYGMEGFGDSFDETEGMSMGMAGYGDMGEASPGAQGGVSDDSGNSATSTAGESSVTPVAASADNTKQAHSAQGADAEGQKKQAQSPTTEEDAATKQAETEKKQAEEQKIASEEAKEKSDVKKKEEIAEHLEDSAEKEEKHIEELQKEAAELAVEEGEVPSVSTHLDIPAVHDSENPWLDPSYAHKEPVTEGESESGPVEAPVVDAGNSTLVSNGTLGNETGIAGNDTASSGNGTVTDNVGSFNGSSTDTAPNGGVNGTSQEAISNSGNSTSDASAATAEADSAQAKADAKQDAPDAEQKANKASAGAANVVSNATAEADTPSTGNGTDVNVGSNSTTVDDTLAVNSTVESANATDVSATAAADTDSKPVEEPVEEKQPILPPPGPPSVSTEIDAGFLTPEMNEAMPAPAMMPAAPGQFAGAPQQGHQAPMPMQKVYRANTPVAPRPAMRVPPASRPVAPVAPAAPAAVPSSKVQLNPADYRQSFSNLEETSSTPKFLPPALPGSQQIPRDDVNDPFMNVADVEAHTMQASKQAVQKAQANAYYQTTVFANLPEYANVDGDDTDDDDPVIAEEQRTVRASKAALRGHVMPPGYHVGMRD